MPKRTSMVDRYENDPQYSALVDMLCGIILKLDLTPSEVRECAMLACIKVESLKPASWRISADQAEEFAAIVRSEEQWLGRRKQ